MRIANFKHRAIDQSISLLAAISLMSTGTPAHAQVSIRSLLPGVTSLMPYSVNGQPHFVAYSGETGDALFCRLNADGSGWTQLAHYGWDKGGLTLMPYQVNGQPYFIGYSPTTGRTSFTRILPDGARYENVAWYDWTTGGLGLIPYEVNGEPHFVGYNQTTGLTSFTRILPDGGRYENLAWYGWDKGETFAPYQVNGVPYFLSYNGVSGLARFNRVETDGGRYTLLATYQWGKYSDSHPASGVQYWTNLATFTANGNPYLLLYGFNNLGAGEFPVFRAGLATSQILPSGGLVASVSNAVWDGQAAVDHYWSQFMSFQLNGRPWLLAYSAATGQAWLMPMPGV